MGKLGGWGLPVVTVAALGSVFALSPTASVARAAVAPTVTVYPLGDSITFGASGPYAVTPGGYRGTLSEDLSSSGVTVDYVGTSTGNPPVSADLGAFRHDGHPGFRIDQVGTDLEHYDNTSGSDGGFWMTGGSGHSAIHPQVVILLIGTNDILENFDPGRNYPGGYDNSVTWERDQFVSDMTARLWSLLTELEHLDPGMRLVLCTIPPMGVRSHDPTDAAFNRAVRSSVEPTARFLGMRIVLADVEADFLTQPSDQPDLIGPDGVHPTPVGYTRMAGLLAKAVIAVDQLR